MKKSLLLLRVNKRRERRRGRRIVKPQKESLVLKCEPIIESVNFTSPTDLFESLLAPVISERAFFSNHWETKPIIVKRQTSCNDYDKFFSLKDLRYLIKCDCVRYGQNLNVCRYISGTRQSLNGKGPVSLKECDNLWTNEKATLQFHQPQQFKDVLWRLLSLLETYFGCLVGSNVYITPSGSQGLAPHYDDVEVFILQLEGSKHWRLYPPTTVLPETCSQDLNMEYIGEPSHDLILEVGDMMYFPRGTIHHADTPINVLHSTHLTISTYQNHSGGNLLRHVLPTLLEDLIEKEPSVFRRGLPLNHLHLSTGYGCHEQLTTPLDCNSLVLKTVQELMPIVTRHVCESVPAIEEQYSMDFITSRLPPYSEDGKNPIEPAGRTPCVSDKVYLCWPDHTYLHYNSPHDNDEWAYVYHSLHNDRRSHMMTPATGCHAQKPRGLKFPRAYLDGLLVLFSNNGQYTTTTTHVSSLPLPCDDQLTLVMTLWAEGLLAVK